MWQNIAVIAIVAYFAVGLLILAATLTDRESRRDWREFPLAMKAKYVAFFIHCWPLLFMGDAD